MTRTGWVWTAIIAIIVIIGIIWLFNSGTPTQTNTTTSTTETSNTVTPPPSTTTAASGSAASTSGAKTVTVTYDGSSFSPASVTVAKGDTVNFVASNGSVWVASNQHPSHTGYDNTSRSQHCAPNYTGPKPFDQCADGSSFSFTFTKAGTFGYHNHLSPGVHGTVIVK